MKKQENVIAYAVLTGSHPYYYKTKREALKKGKMLSKAENCTARVNEVLLDELNGMKLGSEIEMFYKGY